MLTNVKHDFKGYGFAELSAQHAPTALACSSPTSLTDFLAEVLAQLAQAMHQDLDVWQSRARPGPLEGGVCSPPGSMTVVEWDELVKPGIYALELILTSVVAFGTADKLLYSAANSGVRCALGDSVATCSAVVVLGSLCFLGAAFTLWLRLLAAFSDATLDKVDEIAACGMLAFGWLIIAILLSAKARLDVVSAVSTEQFETIQAMRDVIVAFSWVNFVAFMASAVLAAYKPGDDEVGEAHLGYEEFHGELASGTAPRGARGVGAAGRSADGLLGGGALSGEPDKRLERMGLRRAVEVPAPSLAGPSSLGDVKRPSQEVDLPGGDILSAANDAEWSGAPPRRKPMVAFITPRSEAAARARASAKANAAAKTDAAVDAEAETTADSGAAAREKFLS